jgi:hypothetical protein
MSRVPHAPPDLESKIRSTLLRGDHPSLLPLWTAGGDEHGDWLVIKYIPVRYCRVFRPDLAARAAGGGPPGLRISDTPGFTWGPGNYVTPLANPLSTAIYGRAGIVARLDRNQAHQWTVFDARASVNQDHYIAWTLHQPAFRWLTTTCHANLANHYLRKAFREAFAIDSVVFHPDQRNPDYTQRHDVWLCISDWTPFRRLASGESRVLGDPRLTVLVSEEFEPQSHDVRRRSLIGPRGPLPSSAALAAEIRRHYAKGEIFEVTT